MPIPINQGDNVRLEDKQVQTLEEYKSRLINLESEISIASKNLKVIKGETERAIVDRKYQQKGLEDVNAKIDEANTRLGVLFTAVTTAGTSLGEINQEIGKKTDILRAMEEEFKKREDAISAKETDLERREATVSFREIDVKKSEIELSAKHAKLKSFAETI